MIELEKTYLAKEFPTWLEQFPSEEIIDLYIPISSPHPKLRIRKNGKKCEITKKKPVQEGDASAQYEENIELTREECDALFQTPGKNIQKIRYYYDYQWTILEVDVFQGQLKGLIMIDVEFGSEKEKNDFQMPPFCLAEVTQETALAGGMICGKSYADIQSIVEKYGYRYIGE